MGSDLPRQYNISESSFDFAVYPNLQKRRTSASVTEIKDLYTALQELVPSKTRSRSASPCPPISKKISTSCDRRDRSRSYSSPVSPSRSNSSSPRMSRSAKRGISKSKSCQTLTIQKSFEPWKHSTVQRRASLSGSLARSPSPREEDLMSQSGCASNVKRRSIGGSLLLNALVKSASSSPRRNSLADALNIIVHKNEVQELIKNCEGVKGNGIDDPRSSLFRHGEGRDIQDQMEMLLSSINELQKDAGEYPLDQEELLPEFTRRGSVGTEMQELLDALRDLVIAGEDSPLRSPSPSTSLSGSQSEVAELPRTPTGHKESLKDLEAYFMEKLQGVSKKRSPDDQAKVPENKTEFVSVRSQNIRHDQNVITSNEITSCKNAKRSTDTVYVGPGQLSKPTVRVTSHDDDDDDYGHDCDHDNEYIIDIFKPVTSPADTPEISLSFHENTPNNQSPVSDVKAHSRSISSLDLFSSPQRQAARNRVMSEEQSAAVARSRALWKEDQLVFAKQVNDRLEAWLARATALSKQTEQVDHASVSDKTEKDKAIAPRIKQLPRSQSRFNFKMSMKGRTKRSKSLYNAFDPDALNVAENKPIQQRSPQPFRALSRFRLPRSKSMHFLQNQSPSPPSVANARKKTKAFSKPEQLETSSVVQNSSNQTKMSVSSGKRTGVVKGPKVRRALSDRKMNYRTECSSKIENSTFDDNARVPRLPMGLPLFYNPTSKEPVKLQLRREANASVRSDTTNTVRHVKQGAFYTVGVTPGDPELDTERRLRKDLEFTGRTKQLDSGSQHLMDIPVGITQCYNSDLPAGRACGNNASWEDSRPMRHLGHSNEVITCFFRDEPGNVVEKERFGTHDVVGDSTKSESDDSGCPGNEFMGSDSAATFHDHAKPIIECGLDTDPRMATSAADLYVRTLCDLDSETFEI
ncbi:uncharacterized protein LOC116616000 isoform X2 [Nematostella vectensis]|uniref:uncharacterized protein LOC116616000 isoform X2 n=1 Tax=Nematostella vectensis TaxID=45351 RepID=UPI0020773BE6|nr:uncharacterized protein LOC116616000 isoform X2 [Nematostella vectensis]